MFCDEIFFLVNYIYFFKKIRVLFQNVHDVYKIFS